MKHLYLFCLFLIASLSASLAHAATGQQLLNVCKDEVATGSLGVCAGYATAVYEAATAQTRTYRHMSPDERQLIRSRGTKITCLPPDATADQMEVVIVKLLFANAESLHLMAWDLVMKKLPDYFPCS